MSEIENYINAILGPHLDNAQTRYHARRLGHGSRAVSPLTNLVFELFLFNSLYAIDWRASFNSKQLIEHSTGKDGPSETKKQRELVKFCRDEFKALGTSKLCDAFRPLAGLENLTGSWTEISADSRITPAMGNRFFKNLGELARLVELNELGATKQTFGLIDDCCYFVYLVRNNIFHGQKNLGEIHDPDQAQRLGVYDLFVRSLNSMFFLAVGRTEFGAAFAQLPIIQPIGKSSGIHLTSEVVTELVNSDPSRPGLKPEDAFLHWNLFRSRTPDIDPSGALFYPSCGNDFLFPLIVGMPYCTDFYFFEHSRLPPEPKVRSSLRRIGIAASAKDSGHEKQNCYEFTFDSITRRIWFMSMNNECFLDLDVDLTLFFHRGDSNGEGGSDQCWDSGELLDALRAKANTKNGLRILTDGQPGGIDQTLRNQLSRVEPPLSFRGDVYYSGVLKLGSEREDA